MDAVPDNAAPDWLRTALERGEAQAEAGEAVPLDPVLDRLRASIARMRAAPLPDGPKATTGA